MNRHATILLSALVVLLGLPLSASRLHCADGRFTVGARVQSSAHDTGLLEAIVLPEAARALGRTRELRRAVLEAPPTEAARHFRSELARSGWRLIDESTAACGSIEQSWRHDSGTALRVRLNVPLGGFPATLIGLMLAAG